MENHILFNPPQFVSPMIKQLKEIAKQKGYVIFEKPNQLNIWGVRSNTTQPNAFDDQIHVFTLIKQGVNNVWAYWVFKCTTDPGTFWLQNPENPQGTAILNAGQYLNSHAIGLHKGQYTALVQRKAVSVTRDFDRNNRLDFNNGKVTTGIFGINIHRAMLSGDTLRVDKWSAGCQVFKNIKDYNFFIELCRKHSSLYGNQFTYTLLDNALEKITKLKQQAQTTTQNTSFSLQPTSYAEFNPQLLVQNIFSALKLRNNDLLLKALSNITSKEQYKAVNYLFKEKSKKNGVSKTIAQTLEHLFEKHPIRSKIHGQLSRIGLKWNKSYWML